jgi:predicted SprT family Zn-dependent metalloprotease
MVQRKVLNDLAKQLRDHGLLPRSMREVNAQFRKSGEVLSPYEQTDDPPTAHAPLKKSQSYDPTQGGLEMSRQIFRGHDIEHVNGCWIVSRDGKELHRAGSQDDARAWINRQIIEQTKAELKKTGVTIKERIPKLEQTTAVTPSTSEADKSLAITPIEYGGLQEAYDHFNKQLFGELPDVFITYQRRSHMRGFFGANRFSERDGKSGRHELALNPDHFVDRTDEQICSTLVHEMCHVWQHVNGTAPSRNYHNKEWAAKMKSIGLQPSSTGAPGGKETGASVSHYIIPDGAFQKAFEKLATAGWKLNLQSAHQAGAKGGKNSKTKFTCPQCGQNAWGKPDLATICKPCLVAKLEAAGIDVAILDSVEMKSAESADTEVTAAAA